MAAEDAAVTVSLRADLKDYEAALKNAVRATERAAKAAETAIAGVGKTSSGSTASNVIAVNFQKSANQVVNDAKVMQYQLNDIFSGLASGQGMRAITTQLGQISQIIGGGGIRQAASTLTTALIGMVSPVNLAIVAFGVLAPLVFSYFEDSTKKADDNAEAMKKNAKAVQDLAEQYGHLFPELQRMAEVAQKAADIAGEITAGQQAAAGAYAETQKHVDSVNQSFDETISLLQTLGASTDDIAKLQDDYAVLAQRVKEHTATSKDSQKVIDDLSTIINTNEGRVKSLAEAMRTELVGSLSEVDRAAKSAAESIKTVTEAPVTQKINALPLPSIGPPITAGAGVFNPSQTQLENAKKAQEEAERAAKEAARAAERATEQNRREAERAAKEAADRLNEAIANQTKVAVDAVTGLLGKSETANAGEINAFLRRGGVDVDAATTAWCAAFVNSALAQVGIKGTGSNVATSFAGWGKAVNLSQIQRGDVLVEQRGRSAGETGGHVGFATGQIRATADGIQQIEMISGNSANKVQQQWVDATDVIARRSASAFELPASALDHLTDESKAASAAAKKLSDQQMRNAQQLAQAYNQIGANAVGGLVSDLMHGVDAGEAFNNMLANILDSLAQLAIQQIFNPAGQAGGLFGAIFGIGHGGGNVSALAAGRQHRGSPLAFAGAPRYAKGGMVGFAPGEVPIIAHRGEVIVPNARRLAGTGRPPAQQVSTSVGDVSIDMSQTGMVAADNQSAKEWGIQVQKIIQQQMVVESRPGGLLRRVPGAS